MPFRFRRSLKILPGIIRVNLGKRGASLSVSGRGAHVTLRPGHTARTSIGSPGSGLSYTHGGQVLKPHESHQETPGAAQTSIAPEAIPKGSAARGCLWIALAIIFVTCFARAARSSDLAATTVASHSADVSLSWLQLFTALGVGTVAASVIGWWSAKAVAISNSRQVWINALRDDIAEYLKQIDLMHYKIGKILKGPATTDDLDEQQDARASTLLVYRRILMRLNMTESPSRRLAEALEALLKIDSRVANSDRMEKAIRASGVVLKQEWEVTKYGIFTPLIRGLKGNSTGFVSTRGLLACCRRRLNAIGLVLGIIGVVMIFIWGPPQPSFERGDPITASSNSMLPDGRTVAERDLDRERQEGFYRLMSQSGLVLILVGFMCQLGSECIPRDET